MENRNVSFSSIYHSMIPSLLFWLLSFISHCLFCTSFRSSCIFPTISSFMHRFLLHFLTLWLFFLSFLVLSVLPASFHPWSTQLWLARGLEAFYFVQLSIHCLLTSYCPSPFPFLPWMRLHAVICMQAGTLKACQWGAYSQDQLYFYWSNFHQRPTFLWVGARLGPTGRDGVTPLLHLLLLSVSKSSHHALSLSVGTTTKLCSAKTTTSRMVWWWTSNKKWLDQVKVESN